MITSLYWPVLPEQCTGPQELPAETPTSLMVLHAIYHQGFPFSLTSAPPLSCWTLGGSGISGL